MILWPRSHRKKWLALFFVIAVLFCTILFWWQVGAVVMHVGEAQAIRFSPDGSKLVFVWTDSWGIPLPEGPIPKRNITVYWCDVSTRDVQRSVKVDTVGSKYSGYNTVPIGFEFSPDSCHLAIATPNGLRLINLDTARLWRMSSRGEVVTSFAWLANDEIAYVTHTNKGVRRKDKVDRTFWRQKISDGPNTRLFIYREEGITGRIDPWVEYPLEHWSPTGQHVIFF